MIFLTSSAKPIDDSLQHFVDEIVAKSASLSVLSARQYRYNLRQTLVELTVKEPRQFNVLEEFIIRAGIEFEPPPTPDELASILGLDPIFVHSTIANLQKLQTLAVKSPITVTPEGRLFYQQGTVLQPAYAVQIYAIADPLTGEITFQSQSYSQNAINLNQLPTLLKIDHNFPEITDLQLEEIQQIINNADLEFNQGKQAKVITAFRVLPPAQTMAKQISIIVIFDAREDKVNIEIRHGKQVLDLAANTLTLIAEQLWENALSNRDAQFAIEPLCIWGVLGREEFALTAIHQNSWLELLPLWLNIALTGLKSRKLPHDAASFPTALSLLNQVDSEADFIEELTKAWREVIGAIATYNYQTALNLLNNEIWAQFLRLHISQETDSPDKWLCKYTTPQSNS